MRVVILGCGRVGARLASSLDREGHTVSIIDRNSDAFRRLAPDFHGDAILGIGIDEDVLRRAGIDGADVFAAVTDTDNTNIMASQIAREIFHVPKVITRTYDPTRSETYRTLGLETVCPTTLAAARIRDMLVQRPSPSTTTLTSGRHRG